jgi:ABC-2 type transport system permease protein
MTAVPSANLSDRSASAALPATGFGGINFIGLWTLYALTLRQHLHGKRWIIMLVLFLLPAGLADMMRLTAHNVPIQIIEFAFVFMIIPHAILPLVALIYSSGIIQDEQEEQTITYLLIRPVPKWAIYVVKLLATLTTTVTLTFLFTALTFAAIYLGTDANAEEIALRCLLVASIHSLAVAAYCCLFGLTSLLTKQPLVAGVAYILIVEWFLGNIPLGIRYATVLYYTRLIAYRSLDYVMIQFGRTEDLAADAWQLDIKNDPSLLEHPTMQTCFIVLFGACLAFTALAAFICSRREFHVKTPEKN